MPTGRVRDGHDVLAQAVRQACDGRRHGRGGTLFEPAVLTDVIPSIKVATEETREPEVRPLRCADEHQAIALANATRSGLADFFHRRDSSRVRRVAGALESGRAGSNEGIISTELAPFGGLEASGLGHEGSRHGIDQFTELQYLCPGGLDT